MCILLFQICITPLQYMSIKLFFTFFLLPCLLFAEIVETFYGDLDVKEPVILELLQSPTVQRLKKIHQYGVSYYAGSHKENFTRYDHTVGVFAILRLKGCSLQEQIAGLLHDVSHTVFSHVGDWVFSKENQEKDYQNEIHLAFIEKTELGDILKKHGYSTESILPLEENFPALEQPLPNLCADRIEYNLQGAFFQGYITKPEARKILDDLQFTHRQWVCSNPKLMEKVVRFSLFMTRDCWGSPENEVRSQWLADALLKGVETGLISMDDIHFSTDDYVWKKLLSSKDAFIAQRIKAISQKELSFRILKKVREADVVIKSKFRGIDPMISHKGKRVRLTSINSKLAKEYKRIKKEMERGWAIKYVSGVPLERYEGPTLKKWGAVTEKALSGRD